MQNANQYAFRVRRDANKTEIKAAVELMFDVKVAGVQVVERARQGPSLRQAASAARRTGRRLTSVWPMARRSTTKPRP